MSTQTPGRDGRAGHQDKVITNVMAFLQKEKNKVTEKNAIVEQKWMTEWMKY